MRQVETLIAELSPAALHRLADEYLLVSNRLRAAAKAKAAALSRDSESQRRRSELESIPALVAGYRAGGMTAEAAIRAAALAAGVDDRCVMAWLKHDRRQEQDRAAEATRREALALAAEGYSIRQIAHETGLPRSTVGRLVKDQAPLEASPGNRAAPIGAADLPHIPDIRAWAAE